MHRMMKLSFFAMAVALAFVLGCGAAEAPTQQPATPLPAAPPQPAPAAQTAPTAAPQQPATPLPAPTAAAVSEPQVPGLIAPTPAAPLPRPTVAPAETIASRMGGTLRWIPQGSVQTLDPVFSSAAVTRAIGLHIWDKLLGQDEQGVLQPDMLDNWKVENDGTRFLFTLRDGLMFHNGQPVTIEDVIASVNRWRNQDSYGTFFNPLITQPPTKVDEKSFVVELSRPSGLLIAGLGKPGVTQPIITTREMAATDPKAQMPQHIGSGPYKFVNWEPGNRLVLERFAGYKPRAEPGSYLVGGKIAYINKLEMVEVPDQETRVAAVLTGEVDFIDVISGDYYDRVQRSDRVQAHIGRPGAQPIFYFNKAKPPFDNSEKGILMRKAVQALTNAEEIMLGYGAKELWSLCPTMWFCDSFWDSREGTEAYNQKNVAKARELLAQAGYDGTPIILMDPADFPTIHPIPIVLKSQLEAAGIKVDYRVMDWATETTIVLSQNPDDLNKWHIAPTWLSSVLLHPLNNTLIANGDLGRYQSERMDALRKQLADAVDPAEQKRLAAEIQKVFFDEAPYVHLGQFFQLRVLSKDLKGFVGAPVGSPYFVNMYWDDPSKRR